jgi:hypothetical protein
MYCCWCAAELVDCVVYTRISDATRRKTAGKVGGA